MSVKKKWIIFYILLFSLFVLVSCNQKVRPSQEHTTHTYSTIWSKNETKHWKECSCGKRSEEENHSFGEWKEMEPATVIKEGLKEQTCSICNYKKKEKINKVEPIYNWKSIDLLQPNIIMGGTNNIVLDENGNKVEFTKLVDRQIDMLAQEIISRLEYVYGDSNANEVHNIKDNLNNKTFTSYNSMNVFSDRLYSSNAYPVYRHIPFPSSSQLEEDPYIEQGYIEMRNGERVEFDSKIHSHYITLNNKRYAAICSENAAGNFTSETSLQYTFETLGAPTIYHKEIDYYSDFLEMFHAKVLTFQGAIYGTPTWKHEEKGDIQRYYEFSYDAQNMTDPWNWAEDFKNDTAKNKLKKYFAYILANKLTSYDEIPLEEEITNTKYENLLKRITVISNYVTDYNEIILSVISNRIIGKKMFENDIYLGELGDEILTASYVAASSSYREYSTIQRCYNWEIGLYAPLYQVSGCVSNGPEGDMYIYFSDIDRLNKLANTSFSMDEMVKVYDYKGYDVIVKGILNQISKQSAYKNCNPLSYEQKSISSNISTTLEETEVYLFLKASSQNDVRIYLDVPYVTEVKLKDKDGKEVTFTKENVDGKLALRLKGSVLPSIGTVPNDLSNIQGYGASSSLDELLKDSDYLKLIISDVSSITLTTEEAVQVN